MSHTLRNCSNARIRVEVNNRVLHEEYQKQHRATLTDNSGIGMIADEIQDNTVLNDVSYFFSHHFAPSL